LPIENVDYNKLSKDVFVFDWKKSRLACIKTIREFMKSFEMNQFDVSCALCLQFHELLKVCLSFIKNKKIYKEFSNYVYSLSSQFEILFDNYTIFMKSIMDKTIPKF